MWRDIDELPAETVAKHFTYSVLGGKFPFFAKRKKKMRNLPSPTDPRSIAPDVSFTPLAAPVLHSFLVKNRRQAQQEGARGEEPFCVITDWSSYSTRRILRPQNKNNKVVGLDRRTRPRSWAGTYAGRYTAHPNCSYCEPSKKCASVYTNERVTLV